MARMPWTETDPNALWDSLSIFPAPGLAVFFQKFLPGTKSLRECDFLAFELGEVFPEGVEVVGIPDALGDDEAIVLIEGDAVAVEGGVLGPGEAETVGGVEPGKWGESLVFAGCASGWVDAGVIMV